MTFHFFQVLLFAGLLNAGILMLIFPRLPLRDKRPAFYLGILMVLIALSFISLGILPRFRRIVDWFHLIRIPVVFFIGPVFFLLARSLHSEKPGWLRRDIAHFIPGILEVLVVAGIWVYIEITNPPDRIALLYDPHFALIYDGSALLYTLIYLIAATGICSKTDLSTKAAPTYRSLFYGMSGLLILWLGLYLIEVMQYPRPLCSKYYSPWCLSALFFYLGLGYLALIDPKKLDRPRNNRTPDEDQLAVIYQQIKTAIVQQQLYLNPELTQSDLGQLLPVPNHLISKAIKVGGEHSLTDLLNRLRIETFLDQLNQGRDKTLTLFSIAQESGFKSRATFYRAFKKHTGRTPGAYKAGK